MRNNLQANPLLFKLILLVTCFMLVILYNKTQAAGTTPASRSRVAVSFLQQGHSNEVNVIVKANSSANLQLFLFNTDGLLVKELAVCAQKTTTIKDLDRGCYLYECFIKDRRMTSGSLMVK